jgi:hypothetical protein
MLCLPYSLLEGQNVDRAAPIVEETICMCAVRVSRRTTKLNLPSIETH